MDFISEKVVFITCNTEFCTLIAPQVCLSFISNVEFLSTNMELYETFIYKLNPYERESKFYHIENRYIKNIILRVRKEISELAFLTELIMEVGEIHE